MAIDAPNQASAFAPITEARSTAPHACMMASSISGESESSGSGSDVGSGCGGGPPATSLPGRVPGSMKASETGAGAPAACLLPPNQREKVEACLTLASPSPAYRPPEDDGPSSWVVWENEVDTSGSALSAC